MRTAVSIGVALGDGSSRALASAFGETPGAEVRWLCDRSSAARPPGRTRIGPARATTSFGDLLDDETLDVIAIWAPLRERHGLVQRALDAEKHVLVVGALAGSSDLAAELVSRAERNERCLKALHLSLFRPGAAKLHALLELGHLGELFYLHSVRQRANGAEDVLWSIGADEIALVLDLVGDEPIEAKATGESFVEPGIRDVVSCHLAFATGISAHLHLSSLSPQRVELTSAVGSERVAVLDASQPDRPLAVYERRRAEGITDEMSRTSGDVFCPQVPIEEPLRTATAQFVAATRSGPGARPNGQDGAKVVSVLELLDRSLGVVRPQPKRTGELRVVDLPVRAV